MSIHHFIRRLHVYAALLVFPWLVMYGASAWAFNHHEWFAWERSDGEQWSERVRTKYDRPVPADADLQAVGREIVERLRLAGRPYAYKPGPRRLIVNIQDFWSNCRVTYDLDQQELVVDDEQFHWAGFLTRMHERSGYAQLAWREDAWAVFVDAASAVYLVLVGSGLWMWWRLPRVRWSGLLALAAGFGSFAGLVIAL